MSRLGSMTSFDPMVYDACYLALALRYGATLFTADGQLQAAARWVGCGG